MVQKHDLRLTLIVLVFWLEKKTNFSLILENREEGKDFFSNFF